MDRFPCGISVCAICIYNLIVVVIHLPSDLGETVIGSEPIMARRTRWYGSRTIRAPRKDRLLLCSRCSSWILSSIIPYSVQLPYTCRTHKEVDRGQTVVHWYDDERVPHPDETGRSQGDVLRDTQLFGWTTKVFHARTHQAPLHERCPEEYRLRPCRVVHERLKFGDTHRGRCSRHDFEF